MENLYAAITSWAALITALIACYAIWVDGKRSRFSQGLDILLKFSNEFNNEDMKTVRRQIAQMHIKKTKKLNDVHNTNLESEILNHFQTVGLLLRKKILDPELTWSEYSYWVRYYLVLFKSTIDSFREEDQTAWEDVDWMMKRFSKLDKKYKIYQNKEGVDQPEFIEFLQSESEL